MAGTVAAGSALTTASVGAAKEEVGVREANIETPVKRLLRNRRWEQAVALLERNNVEFDHRVVEMPTVTNPVSPEDENPDDGGGVSTQAEYNRTNSKFAHTVYLVSGNVYRASLQWTLEYEGEQLNACIDHPGPVDAASVTFSQSTWEPVLNSWQFGPNTSLYDRKPEGVIGSFVDPSYVPATGCSGSILPVIPSVERRSGWMRVDIRKKQAGSHNVYGTYVHTWSPLAFGGSVSFSIAVGPISVSTGSFTSHWTKRNDRNV